MKEIKEPQTEMEYWQYIESLGWGIWNTNHSLSRGRIENTPELEKELAKSRELQRKYVEEISKYGVVGPENCPKVEFGKETPKAPEGKIWYWDWYKKMKEEFYSEEYNKMICSACPLSGGVERFISMESIPCKPFNGTIYNLRRPYLCTMISNRNLWTRETLMSEIEKEGGKEAVKKFEEKEIELKKDFEEFKKKVNGKN